MASTLTMWTAVNKKYELFIPTFIFFAAKSNPGSRVVIGLENVAEFESVHSAALSYLEREDDIDFGLVETDFSLSIPHAVRFLDFPEFDTEWVYFTDADVMLTDDVLEASAEGLSKTGLPFNNVVRAGTRRLTGLHLHHVGKLWPSLSRGLKVPDSWTSKNDEEILYELVEGWVREGFEAHLEGATRPVPGLHVSLFSRFPLGSIRAEDGSRWIGWGGGSRERADPDKILAVLASDQFLELERRMAPSAALVGAAIKLFCLAKLAENEVEVRNIPALTGPEELNARLAKRLHEAETGQFFEPETN